MSFDETFWVAVSFFIFFGLLAYFKIPQKINELLNKQISEIKNEIGESEKLRNEAKDLLENSQNKLNSASDEGNKIIDQIKKDSERLVIEMNDKFHKSAEIKKKLAETKINQMKDAQIKPTIPDISNSLRLLKTKIEAMYQNHALGKLSRPSEQIEAGAK